MSAYRYSKEKWVELLKHAGVTKGAATRGDFVAAHMHGPTIWHEENGRDVLIIPLGWEVWAGDDEWLEIEKQLEEL